MKASTSFWIGGAGVATAVAAYLWGRKCRQDVIAALTVPAPPPTVQDAAPGTPAQPQAAPTPSSDAGVKSSLNGASS